MGASIALSREASDLRRRSLRILPALVATALISAFSLPPIAAAASPAVAAVTRGPSGSMKSLKSLLNPDGTLNRSSSFTGSLDASGYRMETVQGGAPRFVASSPARLSAIGADANWNSRFGLPGTGAMGYGLAIAASVRQDGGLDIYLGGTFSQAAGVATNNIAHWNGQAWSPMGSGVNGLVRAIALIGPDVYVGGSFTVAGGVTANLVAMWNGVGWAALKGGLKSANDASNAAVNAIAAVGNRVYVGGNFDSADGKAAYGIAEWDGVNWSALGASGGVFTCFGCGPSQKNNGYVKTFAVMGSPPTLYVGGNWKQVGDPISLLDASGIARWDPSANTWSAVGGGPPYGATLNGSWDFASVNSLATDGLRLFAGGSFDSMGLVAVNDIAVWYQGIWAGVAGGVGGSIVTATVATLAFGGGVLYAGGTFDTAGGMPAQDVAGWDSLANTWGALGSGVAQQERQAVNYFAVDAIAANPLGGALVTGTFVVAGGREVNYVARWSGSDWSTLGEGFPACGIINAVAAGQAADVYAGGTQFNVSTGISQAGNTLADRVARWDGTHWNALSGPAGQGIIEPLAAAADVNAIAVDGANVYVGGLFTVAGGVPANNVAKWDGSAHVWSQLGSGTDDVVNALAILGDYLYVGGKFSKAGPTSAAPNNYENIARWNLRTSSWSRLTAASAGAVGLDFANTTFTTHGVKAISFWQSRYVLIGGEFNGVYETGGTTATDTNGLLQWDSTTSTVGAFAGWSNPGGGVSPSGTSSGGIRALAVVGDETYVGGPFTSAGNPPMTATGVAALNLVTNQWRTLMNLVGGTPTVNALAVSGTDVFVAGDFATVDGQAAGGVARWSSAPAPGKAFTLGSGLAGATCPGTMTASALTVASNGLFVGGNFLTAGTVPSSHFAAWSVAAISASTSTVTANPPSVFADGTTTSTITVTLKDTAGSAVSGKSVSLASAGPGTPTISPVSAITDGSGVASFSVRSTTAGTDTFQATASDTPPVVVTQTATVVFYATIFTGPSTQQYHLANSDGTTWQDMDAANLRLTITPPTNVTAVLSANADLWTASEGYNQDIGIDVNGTILGWKESGAVVGAFSPNAAFVQAVVPMNAGVTYTVKLRWKTNKPAAGATIYAGAGPISGLFSPTRLTARLLPTVPGAVSTQQYSLANSNGSTWVDMDTSNLSFSVTPPANSIAVIGGNADLWTANAGFNQDMAIVMNGTVVAWKESGGVAAAFSPNAAFVQAVQPLTGGTTYTFKLQWKTNKPASGATIFAGAGPINGQFSPTRLTLQLFPASTNLPNKVSTQQYQLANSDSSSWVDIDPAGNLTLSFTPAVTTTAIVSGNADLWTSNLGYNQDIGIDVNGAIVAWKESGGFAGAFSPNAAFVQHVMVLNGGTTYTVKLRWKANKPASGATIWAGAGPSSGQFSPTSLTVQFVP